MFHKLILAILVATCIVQQIAAQNNHHQSLNPNEHAQYGRNVQQTNQNRTRRMYALCPPKFNRVGNECYFISKIKVNWLDAHFECKDRNSKLAEPLKFDDKALRKNLIQKDIDRTEKWIGGIYNWERMKWQWGYNGRDMTHQSFSQMKPGSSGDLRYHCAVLNPELKYRWSARSCSERNYFVCQHRMRYVTDKNRQKIYNRWNATFPNEMANEIEVIVSGNPNKRKDFYRATLNKQSRINRNRMRQRNEIPSHTITNQLETTEARHNLNPLRVNNLPSSRDVHQRRNRMRTSTRTTTTSTHSPNDVYNQPMIVQYAPDPVDEISSNGEHFNGRHNAPNKHRPRNYIEITRPTTTTSTTTTTTSTTEQPIRRADERIRHDDRNHHHHHTAHHPRMDVNVDQTEQEMKPILSRRRELNATRNVHVPTHPTTTTTLTMPLEIAEIPEKSHSANTHELSKAELKQAERDKLRKRLQQLSPAELKEFYEMRKLRKQQRDLEKIANETIP